MTFDFSKTIGISQSLIYDTLCALILTKAPLPCSFLSLMDDPFAWASIYNPSVNDRGKQDLSLVSILVVYV